MKQRYLSEFVSSKVPNVQVNVAGLSRGVSATVARQQIALAETALLTLQQQRRTVFVQKRDTVALLPEFQKVKNLTQANLASPHDPQAIVSPREPNLLTELATYRTALRRLGPRAGAQRLAGRLETQFEPLLKRFYPAIGLNPTTLSLSVQGMIPGINLLDPATGAIIGQGSSENVTTTRLRSGRTTELAFRAPFGFSSDDTGVNGLTLAPGKPVTVDAATGVLQTDLAAQQGAGSALAAATIGQVFTVPPGVRQVLVEAEYERDALVAVRGFFGAAAAEARLVLSVAGPEGLAQEQSEPLVSLFTPFLGNRTVRMAKETHLLRMVFTPAAGGGHYVLRLSAESLINVFDQAQAESAIQAKLLRLTVRLVA